MNFQLVSHHTRGANAYIPFRLHTASPEHRKVANEINDQLNRHDGVVDRYSNFDGLREDEDVRPGEVTVANSRFGRSRYDVALRFTPGEDQPIKGANVVRNRERVLSYYQDQNETYHVRLHDPAEAQTYIIHGKIGREAEVDLPFWPG